MSAWSPRLRVSVNVAARELGEAGSSSGSSRAPPPAVPGRMALEMTETTLMEGSEAAISGLEALAAPGLQVYLDDFGTGYSSLTRLAPVPADGVQA